MIVQPANAIPRPAPAAPSRAEAATADRFLQDFLAEDDAARKGGPHAADGEEEAAWGMLAGQPACPPPLCVPASDSRVTDKPGLGAGPFDGVLVSRSGDAWGTFRANPAEAVPPPSPEGPWAGTDPAPTLADAGPDPLPGELGTDGPTAQPIDPASARDGPKAPSVMPPAPAAGSAEGLPAAAHETPTGIVLVGLAVVVDRVPGDGHDTGKAATLVARPMAEQIWSMQGLLPPPAMPPAASPRTVGQAVAGMSSPAALDDPQQAGADMPKSPIATDSTPAARLDGQVAPIVTDLAGDIGESPAVPLSASFANPASGSADAPARATHPTPSLPPGTASALVAIAANPSQGTVVLTLAPEELGSLHVRITQGEGGLHVILSADRPETLDLLRRHAGELAQDLRQAGFAASTFSFAEGGDAGGAGAQRQPASQTTILAGPAFASQGPTPPAIPIASVGPCATDTGLDLRL